MQLSLRSFARLVEASSAAVQGSAAQLLDLTVGSVLFQLGPMASGDTAMAEAARATERFGALA